MPDQGGINLVNWLQSGFSALAVLFTSLLGFIWKSDRKRIKDLEDYVSNHAHHAITRPEVETIVTNVKIEFKDDHRDILSALKAHREEIREDFKEMRTLLIAKYQGPDRRKQK